MKKLADALGVSVAAFDAKVDEQPAAESSTPDPDPDPPKPRRKRS